MDQLQFIVKQPVVGTAIPTLRANGSTTTVILKKKQLRMFF